MDIEQTLKGMRDSARGWSESGGEDLDYGDDMVSYFEAIDEWLSKGGFFPADWNGPRTTEVNEVLRSYGMEEIA